MVLFIGVVDPPFVLAAKDDSSCVGNQCLIALSSSFDGAVPDVTSQKVEVVFPCYHYMYVDSVSDLNVVVHLVSK